MDFENGLSRLGGEINDAIELLRSASNRASDISGASGGRQGDPELGIPAEPEDKGWPAMGTLCDRLSQLADEVEAAFTQECREAVAGANAYLDEMSDQADGLSY